MNTKNKGNNSEQLVCDFLIKKGNTIIARNYYCTFGEIDILSLTKDGILCVTEVKTISSYWPEDDIRFAVDYSKQIRLKKTLKDYLVNNKVSYSSIRFDVASVTGINISYFDGAF